MRYIESMETAKATTGETKMTVFEIIAALKSLNTAIISDETANNRNFWADTAAAYNVSASDMAVLVFGLDQIRSARNDFTTDDDVDAPNMINAVYTAEITRLIAAK